MYNASNYNHLPSEYRDTAVTELDKVDWTNLYNDPRYNGEGDFVIPTRPIAFPELQISEENPDLALKIATHVQVNEPVFLVNKYPGVVFFAGDRIQDVHEIPPFGHFVLVRNHRFKNIYFIRRKGIAPYADVERAAFRFLNGDTGASIESRNRKWWTWFREDTLQEKIIAVNFGCPIGHIGKDRFDGGKIKMTTNRHSEWTYSLILQRDSYPSLMEPKIAKAPEESSANQPLNNKVIREEAVAAPVIKKPSVAAAQKNPPVDSAPKPLPVNETRYTSLTCELDYEHILTREKKIVDEHFPDAKRCPVKGLIKQTRDGKYSVEWTTRNIKPVVINIIPESRKVHEKNLRSIFGYLAAMHVTGEEITEATAPYSGSDDSDYEDEDNKTPQLPSNLRNAPHPSNVAGAPPASHNNGPFSGAANTPKKHAVDAVTPASPDSGKKFLVTSAITPPRPIVTQTPTPRSAKKFGYPVSPQDSASKNGSSSDCDTPSTSPSSSTNGSPTTVAMLTPRHRDRRTNDLLKTELCKNYTELGICKYGESCQFAHGPEELRTVPRHAQWRSKVCAAWLQGGCTYGSRCCYAHEIKSDMSSIFEANPKLESRQLISETPSGLENLDLSDLRPKPTSNVFAASLENDNFTPFMMNLKIDENGNRIHSNDVDTSENVIPSSTTMSARFKSSPDDLFGSMTTGHGITLPTNGQRLHYPSRFFG